jgi:hypothetical protein
VLLDELRFKAAVAITRNLQQKFTKVALQCLTTATVAGVFRRVGDRLSFRGCPLFCVNGVLVLRHSILELDIKAV